MTTTEQYILNYASAHGIIVSADILKSAEVDGIPSTALNWHLRKLVSEKQLFRIGRGQYSVIKRQSFKEMPDEELVRRHAELMGQYPTVRCCLYKGSIIAPLLHHLSYNALTYIEVDKELTEILFHLSCLSNYGHLCRYRRADFRKDLRFARPQGGDR